MLTSLLSIISYLGFLSLSIQQIINNPIQINKDYNPIDYIIIYQSNNIQINTTNKTLNYSV